MAISFIPCWTLFGGLHWLLPVRLKHLFCPGILLAARLREITTSICYPLLDGFVLGIRPVWFAFFFYFDGCVYIIPIEAIWE